MPAAVSTDERCSGLTTNPVVVTTVIAASVVAVVIGIPVVTERRGGNGACRADCATDHARSYLARPEAAFAMIDARVVLLHPDDLCPGCSRVLQRPGGDHG